MTGQPPDPEDLRTRLDMQWVLSDVRGRRTLQRIMECAGMGTDRRSPFPHPAAPGLERTVGAYEVALSIAADVRDIDPRYLPQMASELAIPPELPGVAHGA